MQDMRYDLTGLTFGRLAVVERVKSSYYGGTRWLCRCECGGEKIALGRNLRAGLTTSCGCFWRERVKAACTTHGEAWSKEWLAWQGAIRRCEDSKDPNYGGRGVRFCAEWRHDYPAFLAHIGRSPSPRHTLDRKDNDRGYEPGNVRWATPKEQRANQRKRVAVFFLILLALPKPAPAIAARCPHGELFRVSMGKCVALGSPLAIGYQSPTYWMHHAQRIAITLPEPPEPPLKPSEIPSTVPDVDPDIVDIPLTDPDPAAMALKQQLEKQ